MKHTGITLLVFTLVIGWAFPARAAVSPSLLANPGAEDGDLTGWTQEVTDEAWTVSAVDPYEGTNSFLSGNGTSTLTQTVDLLGLGYTEAQLDSITGVAVSARVRGNDDEGEEDTYDIGLQMLGGGFGAMAITSLPDPHAAPAEWTERTLGLGSYGAGMRHLRVVVTTTDGAGTSGNHGASFDDIVLTMADESDPTVTSLAPSDGATGVSTRPELRLSFGENVSVGSGDINVRRSRDDEAVATVDVESEAVAGAGTDTIVVTLPGSLSKYTDYYVTVDAGAFEDPWGNAYAGISTPTGWNFRTLGSGTSVVSRTYDYAIADVTAKVSDAGLVRIAWQAGVDVPFARVFVSADGGEWERISDFLSSGTDEWDWDIPTRWQGAELAFYVESSDLANRLGGEESETVVWQPASDSSADDQEPSDGPESFVSETGAYLRTALSDTVYFVDADGYRHPVPNPQTYFSWEHSFDAIQVVGEETLVAFPLGVPLLPKPGTVLVKVQSMPQVFAIDGTAERPTLRWVSSESIASDLYGSDWAEYVVDIPPTMWPHLSFGTEIGTADDIAVDRSLMVRREELGARENAN